MVCVSCARIYVEYFQQIIVKKDGGKTLFQPRYYAIVW